MHLTVFYSGRFIGEIFIASIPSGLKVATQKVEAHELRYFFGGVTMLLLC